MVSNKKLIIFFLILSLVIVFALVNIAVESFQAMLLLQCQNYTKQAKMLMLKELSALLELVCVKVNAVLKKVSAVVPIAFQP